jgi:hypothetical protein
MFGHGLCLGTLHCHGQRNGFCRAATRFAENHISSKLETCQNTTVRGLYEDMECTFCTEKELIADLLQTKIQGPKSQRLLASNRCLQGRISLLHA